MTTARGFAAALCLLAAPVRCLAENGDALRAYFCDDIKRPFFRAAADAAGGRTISAARPRSIASAFRMPKPPGTARVFIVGESAAGRLGAGENGLRESLEKAFPGKRTEVVNCGMAAYESSRIQAVFEETLEYSPDLVVVLSGNNENGRDPCPDLRAEFARRKRKLRIGLAALSMPEEEAAHEISLRLHEERLRTMAGLAAKAGVPVMFATLPANLSDFAPEGEPSPGVRSGISLLYGGDPRGALAVFSKADARDPFALFYSGRALQRLGRPAEAEAAYYKAVKYDPAGDRSSAERNEMIRAVAAGGACLADLQKDFASAAKDGITGGGEISDGVHWRKIFSPFANAAVGRAAAACLGKGQAPLPARPEGGAAADFPELFSYACAAAYDQAAPGGHTPHGERAVILLERLRGLDEARLRRLLSDRKKLEEELLDSDWAEGLKENADNWLPYLKQAAAEMFRRAGNASAAEAVGAGAAPGREPARASEKPGLTRPARAGERTGKELSDAAVDLMKAGRFAEARPLLERAAAADGDSLETRLNACWLAARLKDPAFGEEHCGEAVYLAVWPPPHSLPVQGGAATAFRARALMRLEAGGDACADLRAAARKAEPGWDGAAQTAALIKEHCR